MVPGEFFFLSEDFFSIHDPQNRLSRNKSEAIKRPFLYAFQDKAVPDIHWMVPVSSQIAKYEEVARRRVQQTRHYKSERGDSVVFGNVSGSKSAFLIQNMIPVTEKYISSQYTIRRIPVTPNETAKQEVITASTRALLLSYSGYSNVFSTNVHKLRSTLLSELHKEAAKSDEASASAYASASTSKVTLEDLLSKTSLNDSPKPARASSLPQNPPKKTQKKRFQKSL